MLKYLLVFATLVLGGCTSTSGLPTTDTIIQMKATNDEIIANSEDYSYHFSDTGIKEEYQRYNRFYNTFHDAVSGMKVNFTVKDQKVTAGYLVVVDKRKLNDSQNLVLIDEYKATYFDSDHVGVMFEAIGWWSQERWYKLDESTRLATPIVVSINDNTKNLNFLGEMAIAPFFLFIMIYGCATGPCV